MSNQWLPVEGTPRTESTTIPTEEELPHWLGHGLWRFFSRLLLGISSAWVVGIATCVVPLGILFGTHGFPTLHFCDLVVGGAMAGFWGTVVMSPGIILLLILDQCSVRFQQARWRPLCAGAIGLVVLFGWCLLLGFSLLWNPISIFTFMIPTACFLSGATFAWIVTFPSLSLLWTSPR